MSSSNRKGETGFYGNGGRRKRKTPKSRREHVKEETAPHILAALEAQRARLTQVAHSASAHAETDHGNSKASKSVPPTAAMQQQPDTLALPGFVFDPTRNRYFRAVKGTLGNPAESARPVKKKRLPIILKVSSKGASSGGSSGIGSSTSVASIPPNNAAVVSVQETVRRGIASRAKGLHAFAMNSRRGIWGTAGTLASPGACVRRAIAESGPPAPHERFRRLAIESIVSSSRFRARTCDAWTYRGAYSAIDWDPTVGLVVVGTTSGEIGIRQMRDPWLGCCSEDRLHHDGSTRREGIPVEFISGPSWSEISDVKILSIANKLAFATASIGCEGIAGGVSVTLAPDNMAEPWSHVTHWDLRAQTCFKEMKRGSVWCIDWDPSTPRRLALGVSSCCPVSLLDVESMNFLPVAKLKSDVFSVNFLPCGAPGTGDVIICGLRDGSVRLVDSRQPPNLNGGTAAALTAPTAAISATLSSRSSGRGGDRSAVTYSNRIELNVRARNRHGFGPRSFKSPSTAGKTLSVGGSSSVDHIHVLQDGTRCLVRRRFGDLHVVDLRFAGRTPRVLVETPVPATFVPVRGRFALDDKETVVATPISSTIVSSTIDSRNPVARPSCRAEGGEMEVGAGERFSSAPPAWNAFSRGGGGSNSSNGVVRFSDSPERSFAEKGDRLRILSLTTGEVLSEISTPWTGLSLARGWGTGRGETVSGCCSQSDVKFLGITSGFDKSAAVFEASL